MKNKKYRLKPYDKVAHHHFISKEAWTILAEEPELEVDRLGGLLAESVVISPKSIEALSAIGSRFMVDKTDLYEVEEVPINPTTAETSTHREKTYTKNAVREAGVRVMMDADWDDEDTAIASALAIAKLINTLN